MSPIIDFTIQIKYANWNNKLAVVVCASDRISCVYNSSCSFIRFGSALRAAQLVIIAYAEKQKATVGRITVNDKVLYMETKEKRK